MARRGVALLEVLVAMSILGIVGAAAVTLIMQAMWSEERAYGRERDIRAATDFFEAVALWPREDLDRRLGDHAQGPWRLEVIRRAPNLYRLLLRDSTDQQLLVHTTVYRPLPDSTVLK